MSITANDKFGSAALQCMGTFGAIKSAARERKLIQTSEPVQVMGAYTFPLLSGKDDGTDSVLLLTADNMEHLNERATRNRATLMPGTIPILVNEDDEMHVKKSIVSEANDIMKRRLEDNPNLESGSTFTLDRINRVSGEQAISHDPFTRIFRTHFNEESSLPAWMSCMRVSVDEIEKEADGIPRDVMKKEVAEKKRVLLSGDDIMYKITNNEI
ncbi:hypothetical protein GN244_ATG01044 [Phytophthora infestans]|uniref:Uncharacterized protein n=1 Tax=Phytophthora infestans TaxID=4787 RepID=A0A833WN31_PHYIN|nr:hypothetical protein GN244_ATG01044 [Phytophthora infestans]